MKMNLYEWNNLTIKLFKEYGVSFKDIKLVYRIAQKIRLLRNECNCVETETLLKKIIEEELSESRC